MCSSDLREADPSLRTAGAFLNCTFGYGAYLLHTVVAFRDNLMAFHLAACAVLIGLATLLWRLSRDHLVTFFHVMTGYAAASFALMKASSPPALLVWLAAQSLLVVATAIAFRSRIIVVANFLIFLLISLGYAVMNRTESGLAAVFGVVALLTARLLSWKQARLELRTGMMRNAYLGCALVAFPYALWHALPVQWVAYGWIALAAGYYGVNLLVRADKYRWLGHATLLATGAWLAAAGGALSMPQRTVSLLVLGIVLLAVSATFTRRTRQPETGGN